jgi:hypothetical protein
VSDGSRKSQAHLSRGGLRGYKTKTEDPFWLLDAEIAEPPVDMPMFMPYQLVAFPLQLN